MTDSKAWSRPGWIWSKPKLSEFCTISSLDISASQNFDLFEPFDRCLPSDKAAIVCRIVTIKLEFFSCILRAKFLPFILLYIDNSNPNTFLKIQISQLVEKNLLNAIKIWSLTWRTFIILVITNEPWKRIDLQNTNSNRRIKTKYPFLTKMSPFNAFLHETISDCNSLLDALMSNEVQNFVKYSNEVAKSSFFLVEILTKAFNVQPAI